MWATLIRQLAIFAAASFGGAWLGSSPEVVDADSTKGWWAAQPMIVKIVGYAAVLLGIWSIYNYFNKKKNGKI